METVSAFGAFVRVAETRSLVAAAQHLGVSASAVGKTITRLERQLGVRLFHRNTRSMTLTAEGELFLVRSRRILAEVEAAEAELSELSTEPRGRLRISLPLVSEPFLPTLLDFQAHHPQIELDLDFTDRKVDLVDEGFDAVGRGGAVEDSRLRSRWLGSFRMILAASPDYLARRGTPQTPADLTLHSCIQFRFPSTGKLQTWPFFEEVTENPDLPSQIISNTLETRRAFAVRGLGIAYLPDFTISDDLDYGRLVPVLGTYASRMGGEFRLLWPNARHIPPKLRVFIAYFAEHMPLSRDWPE